MWIRSFQICSFTEDTVCQLNPQNKGEKTSEPQPQPSPLFHAFSLSNEFPPAATRVKPVMGKDLKWSSLSLLEKKTKNKLKQKGLNAVLKFQPLKSCQGWKTPYYCPTDLGEETLTHWHFFSFHLDCSPFCQQPVQFLSRWTLSCEQRRSFLPHHWVVRPAVNENVFPWHVSFKHAKIWVWLCAPFPHLRLNLFLVG